MKHEEQLTGRRLVAASPQEDDLQPGEEIRPRRLDDYIGQEQVKQS
ncbi:MAG: Holliday junction branch migration DNA helicase RuvB, partial [Opitutae bacterium]|nr:Holliday junction branch migration DNA helicase RuvB [Opitutae bacterium]